VHCYTQSFHYKLVDMHKLNPNIQEVMTFPNWLSAKQNLQQMPSLDSVLYNPFCTLETNTSLAPNFFRFAHMKVMSSETISLLRVWSNSILLNSEKSTTELNGPHLTEIGRTQN
jgi:hypothetical protein